MKSPDRESYDPDLVAEVDRIIAEEEENQDDRFLHGLSSHADVTQEELLVLEGDEPRNKGILGDLRESHQKVLREHDLKGKELWYFFEEVCNEDVELLGNALSVCSLKTIREACSMGLYGTHLIRQTLTDYLWQ